MALNDQQIRDRLTRFAADWGPYTGSEKGEAQTYLNQLLTCFGKERREVASFEQFVPGSGFFDMLWPEVCLWEMKAPSEAKHLPAHRPQVLERYWPSTGDEEKGVAKARYVVLCSFNRFEIWEPGAFNKPRASFDLVDLPDRFESLLFLLGDEPLFDANRAGVTIEAVGKLEELLRSLEGRGEGGPDERQLFILQVVWCMFAEDLGEIPNQAFTRIVKGLIATPQRSSRDDLGGLFRTLNERGRKRPQDGLYKGVPYANGKLFERPGALSLNRRELDLLHEAANAQWSKVQPAIFGSLLTGVLGRDKAWRLGAHYTHETEIQKIVGPTITDPWEARIRGLKTHAQAAAAQRDLLRYVVLDPACGCGNFLYVAYRELRRIEQELLERTSELARAEGLPEESGLAGLVPITNMKGIEIEAFAVDLARVTLWMGHKLAVRDYGLAERTLPLADLSGIHRDDALACEWPEADAIIGNPPYHGSQNLRELYLGRDDYLEWIENRFKCGLKDLCVYWFRRAAEELAPGQRAGLVGTNSISQNRARGASLNYVVEKGGVITEAISRQKWPGEAVVNVSIVNWVQKPRPKPKRFVLDGEEVVGISTRLRESKLAIEEYARLPQNAGRAFQGPIPAGNFYLEPAEAKELLVRGEASYEDVIRPYLIGDDITEEPRQQPRRWIIDFAMRALEDATDYRAALDLVRDRVKPARDENNREAYRKFWWRFAEPRPGMREAISGLDRYIAGNRIGKRFLFCWTDASTCPSDLTIVFAFDDDYSIGVLTSSAHQTWAHAESSTLEDRPRYTPTSCFETFPWPEPKPAQRTAVGEIAAELLSSREAACVQRAIGLTDFYNLLEDGGFREVAQLHSDLDRAVAAAYGWPASVVHDPLEIRARLAALHAEITAGKRAYTPFA